MIGDVEVRPAGDKGLGVFAPRSLVEGEFLFRRRHVRVVGYEAVAALSPEDRMHLCELDVDRLAVLAPSGCSLDHSCDPNAMRHGVVVLAWRPIGAGEEITIDLPTPPPSSAGRTGSGAGRRCDDAPVKRWVVGLVVVVVAGLAGPAGAAAPPPSGTFTTLTYNVAGLPEGLSGSNPSVNTPLISPLLNAYDVVLVQEDWIDAGGVDFFHDDLVSQVTHPYLSTPAPAPQGTDPRRPEALVADGLNRLSRFAFGPITRQMWPHCFGGADTSDGGAGDCLSQKGFSVARTTLAPGVEVDVYNLHGEAGSTPLDEQYTAEDFEVLGRYIAANSAGRAVLVGGDFNLHTDRPVDKAVFDGFLAAAGLTDVCAVVDCGADADEIDKFVFRSGGGVALEPLTHRFERERFTRSDGEPLSDHDPLAVTWRWQSVPAEVDVAPRHDDRRLADGGGGPVPVALLSAPGFDAAAVDPRTACFGDAEDPTQRDCDATKVRARDVDGDGDGDLVLRFQRKEAGIDRGDQVACLTMPLAGGGLYEACDTVRTK